MDDIPVDSNEILEVSETPEVVDIPTASKDEVNLGIQDVPEVEDIPENNLSTDPPDDSNSTNDDDEANNISNGNDPAEGFPQHNRFATTELGLGRMIETGVENPERLIWNDTINPELDNNHGGNPERYG